MRQVNQAGLDLICEFEGCKLKAYQDQKGVWTIGFGHTANVNPGDMITYQVAQQFLCSDLAVACAGVTAGISEATDNQFAAMVSLAYNCGIGAFRISSVRRYHNQKQFEDAAASFVLWDHVHGRNDPGLLRRREAEAALYLT